MTMTDLCDGRSSAQYNAPVADRRALDCLEFGHQSHAVRT